MTERNDGKGIGYGRPPKHSRFRKGESGNPQGRPRADGTKPPAAPFDPLVTVRINGKRQRMRATDAVFQMTIQKALAGDEQARRDVLRYKAQVERLRVPPKNEQQENPFTLIIGIPGECRIIREAMSLGLIEKVGDKQYRIADWARVAARTGRPPRLPPPSGSTI